MQAAGVAVRRPSWLALAVGSVGLLFVGLIAYGVAARAPNLKIDATLARGSPGGGTAV